MAALLLGPLYFVMDTAPTNQITGIVLCAILLPCIAAFPLKPNLVTALVSSLGILSWGTIGIIGEESSLDAWVKASDCHCAANIELVKGTINDLEQAKKALLVALEPHVTETNRRIRGIEDDFKNADSRFNVWHVHLARYHRESIGALMARIRGDGAEQGAALGRAFCEAVKLEDTLQAELRRHPPDATRPVSDRSMELPLFTKGLLFEAKVDPGKYRYQAEVALIRRTTARADERAKGDYGGETHIRVRS